MRGWIPLFLVLAACGGRSGNGDTHCVPGASVACACSNGAMGAQLCDDNGRLGTCSCDGSGGNGNTTTTPPPTSQPGGPMVLSFGASSATLMQGQSITFSAIVTAPAGTDALAGGTLTSPDGSVTYGPLQAGTQKDAFSLALTWAQINQTLSIDFTESQTRVFQAVFFDTAGRKATASFSVTLSCNGERACKGSCVSPTEAVPTECGDQEFTANTARSCNEVCASFGFSCTTECRFASQFESATAAGMASYGAGEFGGIVDIEQSCSDQPAAMETDPQSGMSYAFSNIECCCH